jgi:hypothetical protein
VAFYETFWAVTGAAAPVIALAAVVSNTEITRTLIRLGTAWESLTLKQHLLDAASGPSDEIDWSIEDQAEKLRRQRAEEGNDLPLRTVADFEAAFKRGDQAWDELIAAANRTYRLGIESHERAIAALIELTQRQDVVNRAMAVRTRLAVCLFAQMLNVALQAMLLGASLLSVAYHLNLVPPVLAVALAVLGVVILGVVGINIDLAIGTTRYFQKRARKIQQSAV